MAYINKQFKKIDLPEWKRLREDKEYGQFRIFENHRFRIVAEWDGRVTDATKTPKEFWEIYQLSFYNCRPGDDGEVNYVPDPVMTTDHKTVDEVIDAWYATVERYTESHWYEDDSPYADEGEERVFIEVDNIHNPMENLVAEHYEAPVKSVNEDVAGTW